MPPPRAEPKPILKISTGSRAASVSADTSTPTPSGEKKIKIKISASQPSTPAPSATPTSSVKTKAGRSSKPTAKLLESKKRAYDSDEDHQPLAASRPDLSSRPNKMQKIRVKSQSSGAPKTTFTPSTPFSGIKVRSKGEPPKHTPGDAYDSEASDREMDPFREQVLVLRTIPGSSTDYLHKALSDGLIGMPKANGGADFHVQYLDAKERRAMITINGIHYAAVLTDLPTITEAYKTWDRKNMMKNSDVTQMLLCYAEVKNEQEAKTIPLPAMAQKTDLKWPHGLTPPMHDAVNRRFRKGMSEKQLISVNEQVKKLLADDAEALETTVEWVNDDSDDGEEDEDVDAEGEIEGDDYFGQQPTVEEEFVMDEDDLLAEFEAAEVENNAMEDMESTTPATQLDAQTPGMGEAATPAAPVEGSDGDDEEEISDEDDDDDDDDDDEELDEDQQAKQAEQREMREDLRQLEKKLAEQEAQLPTVTVPMLRQRVLVSIRNFKQEIELKKAALGITEDN